MGGRDEGPVPARPGEDDVAGLVAHEERAGYARRDRTHVHDAHAVGEVVYDPDFGVAAGGHGDRLKTHGYGGDLGHASGADVQDLECVVGSVDREKPRAVRGECERPHLARLEQHELRAEVVGEAEGRRHQNGRRGNGEKRKQADTHVSTPAGMGL